MRLYSQTCEWLQRLMNRIIRYFEVYTTQLDTVQGSVFALDTHRIFRLVFYVEVCVCVYTNLTSLALGNITTGEWGISQPILTFSTSVFPCSTPALLVELQLLYTAVLY